MEFSYTPERVCSQKITFRLEGNVVTDVKFYGGCNGNLKAISKLVDGMTVEEIEKKLLGNTCGFKNTSCADQFAKAVRKAYESAGAAK